MCQSLEGPRRSHSDEAIWKPAAALCVKVVPEGFLRRVRDWFSSLFVISPDSRSGRLLSFINGLKFPTAIVLMLVLTSISLLMVTINTLKLMFGFRSLPVYAQFIEVQTRHKYGLFGAFVEILIILYIIATSFIGLYSLPLMRRIRPRVGETSMTAVIINSSIVLVASSALPVIVNTLGLTTFDLLGAFSSLEWLSSFRIVLAYNLLFITLSLAHLFTQLTAPMRREILRRLNMVRYRIREWRTPAPSDRKMD
ncbi:unnamed protein product [Caenorhabditis auriculariae]|uniref:Uncharacterized protein n=1 Tax=Caenorhabditis auriculariae TaxID=2777116 RepID=A0A8S1GS90_9PELO|nr:unnamed protein product [Caenorhabditis auriculariae]